MSIYTVEAKIELGKNTAMQENRMNIFLLDNIMNYSDYIISYSYNYIIYLIYEINSESTYILNQYGGFGDL